MALSSFPLRYSGGGRLYLRPSLWWPESGRLYLPPLCCCQKAGGSISLAFVLSQGGGRLYRPPPCACQKAGGAIFLPSVLATSPPSRRKTNRPGPAKGPGRADMTAGEVQTVCGFARCATTPPFQQSQALRFRNNVKNQSSVCSGVGGRGPGGLVEELPNVRPAPFWKQREFNMSRRTHPPQSVATGTAFQEAHVLFPSV